jgi:hypothetical protein
VDRDWVRWHGGYDAPGSSLSQRLAVVRQDLRRALDEAPGKRLISLCAGDGRDVLPVLADGHRDVRALLVELDPVLSARARDTAAELGLSGVEVRTADAGDTGSYRDAAPADVLLACGIFGNITTTDVRRTIATLPSLLTPGAIVIWTRGRGDGADDPSLAVRECFTEHGFAELSFTSPADARFRVGMCRLTPAADPGPLPAVRTFTFV